MYLIVLLPFHNLLGEDRASTGQSGLPSGPLGPWSQHNSQSAGAKLVASSLTEAEQKIVTATIRRLAMGECQVDSWTTNGFNGACWKMLEAKLSLRW